MTTPSAIEVPLSPRAPEAPPARRDDVAIGPARPVLPGVDPAADALARSWADLVPSRRPTPAAAEPTAVLEARRPVPVAEIEEGDFFEEETIVPARAPALAALPAAPAAPAEADPDVSDLVERAILAHRRRVLAGSLAVLGALAGVAAALLR